VSKTQVVYQTAVCAVINLYHSNLIKWKTRTHVSDQLSVALKV